MDSAEKAAATICSPWSPIRCFADPEHGDFTLAPDSPAPSTIGFVPIDLSTVGPRVGSAD